ncbi:MAG: hypothetical protein Q9213_001812 [Squamulea squamosa]
MSDLPPARGELRAPSYPCKYCIQFPLFKPKDMAADFIQQATAAGVPGPPAGFNVETEKIAPLINSHLKTGIQLPDANAIKAKIPVFNAAGGGTLQDLEKKRAAATPVYKCDGCRALFILPQDWKDAAKTLEVPLGKDGLADADITIYVLAVSSTHTMVKLASQPGKSSFCKYVKFLKRLISVGEKKVKENELPVFDIKAKDVMDNSKVLDCYHLSRYYWHPVQGHFQIE